MKIVKESLMIIPVLILVGPSNVYAKHSSSTSSTSSSSGITGLSTTTPSNYATKPGAFLSKSNFTSNAAQSVFVARETLNWSLRIVFSIQYWDTCRFRDIPNYAQGRYQAKVRSQPSRTERNAPAFRQIQCCHIFIR